MKIKFLIVLFLVSSLSFSQERSFTAQDIAINKLIDGTLLTPESSKK